MARLPRLAVGGFAHHIIQCVSPHLSLCANPADRHTLRATICQAAHAQHVQLHGWCILPTQFHCIATPADAQALPRMMQDIGRRYVRYFNRNNQRRGTLWNGRFRSTVVDPDNLLSVMACVDALAASTHGTSISPSTPILAAGTGSTALFAPDTASPASPHDNSSAPHYLGLHAQPELTPPAQWWSLGNTPYEREAAYRALLDTALHNPQATAAWVDAALHGWVVGSAAFVQRIQGLTSRRVSKRSPGRPRLQPKGDTGTGK